MRSFRRTNRDREEESELRDREREERIINGVKGYIADRGEYARRRSRRL